MERTLLEQQSREREDALGERLQSMREEVAHLEADVSTLRRRTQLALKNHARFEELARDGFASLAQSQEKLQELLDLQLRERSAERSIESLRRDIRNLQSEARTGKSTAATRHAQLNSLLATLAQEAHENEARGGVVITAPQDGVVSGIVLHAGESVQPGQTFMSLIANGTPDQPPGHPTASATRSATGRGLLEAQLYAPSRTAGFVQPGQTVWLRYAAYPYQKFGMSRGTVISISQTPLAPPDLPPGQTQALLTSAQSNEPLYRITVELEKQFVNTYGEMRPLRPGMSLEGDVIQDRRAV
ncbi:HlyD family efflux transporter periplasmic adaptor subunit [Roseateles sp. SL47]|uniref:HlyD family secretion protein n=1 Tax=Roseateles sp. SL47 TaxID=2995138 RepID=UPI00226E58AB|nr:HlyD family efflux transporter periplasmic adaptor subunit [Roseateles sp. SL47]WAC72838.1 HlyD family efflux transporter periplasmic adaptor subunit [Roseateles sp. SL47]